MRDFRTLIGKVEDKLYRQILEEVYLSLLSNDNSIKTINNQIGQIFKQSSEVVEEPEEAGGVAGDDANIPG